MADSSRIEELRRRVDADPSSIAFAALAEEYRRAGRYREAIEACRTGLALYPMYVSARVTLGRCLIEVGELDEARRELTRVLETAPENLAAIRALAEIHERTGASPPADHDLQGPPELPRPRPSQPHARRDEPVDLDLQPPEPWAPVREPEPVTPAPPPDPAVQELERFLRGILAVRNADCGVRIAE